MLQNARIPCVNPNCRRTAPADGECSGIICRACWRKLPQTMRDRNLQLGRRNRRLLRLVNKRISEGSITRVVFDRVGDAIQHQLDESWHAIKMYFVRPERPIGLEGFLQEVGL